MFISVATARLMIISVATARNMIISIATARHMIISVATDVYVIISVVTHDIETHFDNNYDLKVKLVTNEFCGTESSGRNDNCSAGQEITFLLCISKLQ
jgi:hypothetical protein